MMDRRAFIKLGGGLLGSLWLTACEGTSSIPGGVAFPGALPLPSAMRFFAAVAAGFGLPGGLTVARLTPMCMCSGDELFFTARDSSGALGVYALQISLQLDGRASIQSLRRVLRQGDALPDGRAIASFLPGFVAQNGAYATIATHPNGVQSVVLLPRAGGITRVVGTSDRLGSDSKVNIAAFTHLALDHLGHLLVVARYGRGSGEPHAGLFHFPSGVNDSSAALLLSTGQPAPEGPGVLHRLALIDVRNGHVAVQVGLRAPEDVRAQLSQDGAVAGTLGQGLSLRVAADAFVPNPSGACSPGLLHHGPRVDDAGRTGFLITTGPATYRLEIGGQLITASGIPSPSGRLVQKLAPPLLGPGGRAYYMARCREADGSLRSELLVSDGAQQRVVLTLGQTQPGSGTIQKLFAGVKPAQITPTGGLAAFGMVDGVEAILVGIPA